jgi:hypothetical protein
LTEDSKKSIEKENSIRDFYAHTSRVWNSSVTITVAIIALSITALFSIRDLSIIWRIIVAIGFFVTVIYLGFYRVVELGCQLQFLETELRVQRGNKDETLLEYISGKNGDAGNVPRLSRTYNRFCLDDARELKGQKIGFSKFLKHQKQEICAIGAAYIIVIIITSFPNL